MWPASTRYGIATAPGALGFVQDFLNTRLPTRPDDEDLLSDPKLAQSWANRAVKAWWSWDATAESGTRVVPELSPHDLRELRKLRSAIAETLAAGDEAAPPPFASLELPLRVEVTRDARVVLRPAGSGWKLLASMLLIELQAAQASDTWRRLKVCRAETCGCAFYDRSKNGSAVWHSAVKCGNAVNLRASRARRRAETD